MDAWMNTERMNGRMNAWTDERMDGWMNGWMIRCMNECTNEWMHEPENVRMQPNSPRSSKALDICEVGMSPMNLNRVFFVTCWPDLLSLHTKPVLMWSMLWLSYPRELRQGGHHNKAMQLLGSEGMVCYAASVTYRKGANEVQVYINLNCFRTAVLKHPNEGATIIE